MAGRTRGGEGDRGRKALFGASAPRSLEEKERDVHLLSQSLREASIDDELCSRFQLEQAWGIKSDNAEVVWSLLRGLGAVVVGEWGTPKARYLRLGIRRRLGGPHLRLEVSKAGRLGI